ncbi:heparanase-like protein 2 isoform X2 [Phalaenopsis equestris]|nr:heparanase-like protein 2 isoform X2 [Phalaenopsis equestris]XP_020590058.1 heparanase-like protein 2 isoform X2 [Phalaenopsis equestris]XP_020590059.1 heparanase-like protein 2 isoform X2 [Phalaenopsis equestris]XP_020590060.1 heparanase-like protein 2 isoform X2 [Phalaenopsis equestris]
MRAEGMAFKLVLVLLLFSLPSNLSEDKNDVTIVIKSSAIEAEIDDSFVCATLDWWPHEKCNYNQCPWGNASVLNLDLNHSYLSKSIQAFSPLRIRVGGSLEDQVVYGVGSLESSCDPFTYVSGGLFGFSEGCLSTERWDELNHLFQKTGAIVTFGLNALYGRHQGRKGLWQGPWNSSNALDFMEYTVSKGYPVDSWEFGNELSGNGVSARVGARQYAKDLIVLKAIIDELYDKYRSKPLIVAPGGFFDNQQWYADLLEVSGAGVLNAMSHHVYNLGAGNDPHIVSRIMDPNYLSRFADTFRNVELTIQKHGPWSSAWVGEAGGAYNSGSRLVSNTFLNSFWYLDQLGMAATYNTKVYCRQTLIGGNYGLLDLETFIPNPDYYSALLWHRLMGKGVLSVDIGGSPYLRAYAHCRKQKPGISMLLINLSKSTGFVVTVRSDQKVLEQTVSQIKNEVSDGSERREEYHLSGKDGDYLSRTVLLNGNPLQLTEDGEIPELIPVLNAVNHPLSIAPLSIAFVVFPSFEADSCA